MFSLASPLISPLAASAGDYTVSFGIEIDEEELTDARTLRDCKFDDLCRIESKKLDLRMLLTVSPQQSQRGKRANVSIFGGASRYGCCYFWDGSNSIDLDPGRSFVQLPLYKGHARKRNEYVLNRRFGVLYLQFSDMN